MSRKAFSRLFKFWKPASKPEPPRFRAQHEAPRVQVQRGSPRVHNQRETHRAQPPAQDEVPVLRNANVQRNVRIVNELPEFTTPQSAPIEGRMERSNALHRSRNHDRRGNQTSPRSPQRHGPVTEAINRAQGGPTTRAIREARSTAQRDTSTNTGTNTSRYRTWGRVASEVNSNRDERLRRFEPTAAEVRGMAWERYDSPNR